MKIAANENLIKRNQKIGQIATISSLVILAGGLYLSFQPSTEKVTLSFVALIAGFLLSQIGIYYQNKWGRKPRPDQIIIQALKGLGDKYVLHNYSSPVSHLLVGPSGLWVLIPYHQTGTIFYEKSRWRQKGGNMYLRLFAQEGLGRPDLELAAQISDLRKSLEKKLETTDIPEIQVALVFTNEKVKIEAENAPAPTIPASKLKDLIRKKAKETPLSEEMIAKIESALSVRLSFILGKLMDITPDHPV